MSPRVSKTLWYILLGLHGIAVILPMAWMLSTSLKDSWTIFTDPWGYPEHLRWVNYPNAWKKGDLTWKFLNSIYVSLMALAGTLAVASMAAYVFARFTFPG